MKYRKKYLYVSPVGRDGKPYLEKIITRFGHEEFDYLIMVYDQTTFHEEVFSLCEIVYDASPLFHQVKKIATPEKCRPYDYIFFWMDDIDILDFDYRKFMELVVKCELDAAQPSLSSDSIISHKITENVPGIVGRYTDFVEEMVPVYTFRAWAKLWEMFDETRNIWGWGYDLMTYSYCGLFRMGVIDQSIVRHMRKGSYHEKALDDFNEFKRRNWFHYFSQGTVILKMEVAAGEQGAVLIKLVLHKFKTLVIPFIRPIFHRFKKIIAQ